MLKLTDIRLAGNEHGQLRADVLYAKLRNEEGRVVISADLGYILAAIRDRNLQVEGVEVEYYMARGTQCSEVKLMSYDQSEE